jgi:hypothetical protein
MNTPDIYEPKLDEAIVRELTLELDNGEKEFIDYIVQDAFIDSCVNSFKNYVSKVISKNT